MRIIKLCSSCIQGLQSHGEKIWIGDCKDDVCEMCNDDATEVMECIWEGADSR